MFLSFYIRFTVVASLVLREEHPFISRRMPVIVKWRLSSRRVCMQCTVSSNIMLRRPLHSLCMFVLPSWNIASTAISECFCGSLHSLICRQQINYDEFWFQNYFVLLKTKQHFTPCSWSVEFLYNSSLHKLNKYKALFPRRMAWQVASEVWQISRCGSTKVYGDTSRLDQARSGSTIPAICQKIAKHQRRVAWQMMSMARVVFPWPVVCFQFLHPCTFFFTFFFFFWHTIFKHNFPATNLMYSQRKEGDVKVAAD